MAGVYNAIMSLKQCCADEARSTLRKHLDVATCDSCGRLLLAYGDEITHQLTVDEFEANGVGYDSGRHRELWVVAKER